MRRNSKYCQQKSILTGKSRHFVKGYSAARDTNRGTLFVRAVNEVFRAHAKSEHLLDLLTLVWIIIYQHRPILILIFVTQM